MIELTGVSKMVTGKEKGAFIEVKKEMCKGCGLCATQCPKKLLTLNKKSLNKKGYHFVQFDDSKTNCIGCGMCYATCPDSAINVYKRKVKK